MSFPTVQNFKNYLTRIIELEKNIPEAYRSYWHNSEWLPGFEAFGYIHGDGSYWTAVFNDYNVMLKSYSPQEESSYGQIFPAELPKWAKEVYYHDLWDAPNTTSLILGLANGQWYEPWLAKAWWPLDELHTALPFNQQSFDKWISSLGIHDENKEIWTSIKTYWTQTYHAPELDLDWEAVEEPLSSRETICDDTSCN